MTKLPAQFPADRLDVIERTQVEWFYAKYTQEFYTEYLFGHFIMAAYASIPAYLTPDLLYKLWQNFGRYQWGGKTEFIHNIAVSDVLLAPFCEEVSYEVFRMEEQTRLSFQKWMNSGDPLWRNRSENSVADIAAFIEGYFEKPNDIVLREGERYREEQLMEVKMFTAPGEVARYYVDKLNDAQKDSSNMDERKILSAINALKKAIDKENYTLNPAKSNKRIFSELFNSKELELWGHVLLRNNKTFAKLLGDFKSEVNTGAQLISEALENSFIVQINEADTALIEQLDNLVEDQDVTSESQGAAAISRNIALIIGGSADDTDNCMLMDRTLRRLESKQRWITRILNEPMDADSFMHELQTELKSVNVVDNLVVYISTRIEKVQPGFSLHYFGQGISDSQLGDEFRKVHAASFTLIIESEDNILPPELLNDLEPGKAIFFSSEVSDKKFRDLGFTARFCEALSQSGGKISNRQLHIQALSLQRSKMEKQRLVSNRDTYYRQFASGDEERVKAEHFLRLTGYLDKPASLYWNHDVQGALDLFLMNFNRDLDLEEATMALSERIGQNKYEQKPILLFVFSDPANKLVEIHREVDAAKALYGSNVNTYCEIRIFENRPMQEVTDYVKNKDNRNRIQLFYYAAFDLSGGGRPQEMLNISLFGNWMEYQNSMELVVLNTCWSGQLANQLTQIGAGAAIGNYFEINDDYAADYGVSVIDRIARRKWSFNKPLTR